MVRRTSESSDAAEPKRVALFTPLPPAQTGTADYAAALIRELKKLVGLSVFERVPRGFDPGAFDAVVYQIANNPFHAEIYELALKHPGVVVLHETNLHDLVRGVTHGRQELYLREILYEIFGQELELLPKDGLAVPSPQPRSFAVVRRLLERSEACIVHSRFAQEEVRLRGFAGKVVRIPHGAQVRRIDGAACRERLGIGRGQPLIGIFGYQRPDKQASDCLTVFQTLLEQRPDARLLVAGQPHPEVPLVERVTALNLKGRVHLLGFQPLEDFDGYIAACDFVLNLRSPTFGETSGTMARAFGLGKTVIVSDIGAARELPDDICIKVVPDRYQSRVLLECLRWLLSAREIGEQIGRNAQEWVSRTCTWGIVARAYADFLVSLRCEPPPPAVSPQLPNAAYLKKYLRRWVEPQSEASRYLESHIVRLVRTLQLTPPGGESDRILEMGCYLQMTPALRSILKYGDVRGCYLGPGGSDARTVEASDGECFECVIDLFDAEADPFPYPNDYFSTVLCCELLEHLQHDPMRTMNEIHRVLKPDGILILTTPNAVSLRAVYSVLAGNHAACYNRYPLPNRGTGPGDPMHAREYTPAEIAQLLCDSGFIVVRIDTGPYGEDSFPQESWIRDLLRHSKQPGHLREDCIFAIARKDPAAPRNCYPSWLYDN